MLACLNFKTHTRYGSLHGTCLSFSHGSQSRTLITSCVRVLFTITVPFLGNARHSFLGENVGSIGFVALVQLSERLVWLLLLLYSDARVCGAAATVRCLSVAEHVPQTGAEVEEMVRVHGVVARVRHSTEVNTSQAEAEIGVARTVRLRRIRRGHALPGQAAVQTRVSSEWALGRRRQRIRGCGEVARC